MKFEVLSRVTDELAKQEKPDFKGEVKTFEALERAQREKVLDVYNKWYKRMLKATRSDRVEMYLNALTNVFDPHTGYYSPKDKANFDIQMSGKLEGIGARLQSDGEKTSVTEIVTGGPAWKEGSLSVKDVIVRVGQGEEELVDVMGLEIDDVVSKIRGPKGTVVTLVIQKADGSEKVIKITRDVVLMEEGFAKSLILGNLDNSQKLIGYIYLPKFYADFTPQGSTSCAADVAVEIEKLKAEAVSGIILDLRGNGGGSLRDVVQMSGLFIEEGPIVQVKNRSKTPEIMRDNDSRVQWSGPLVVMVNSFSASASEILAAAMQDYQRAVIVGSASTYGKVTVQRFLDLDNAAREESVKPLGDMKLTIQKFYRISGRTTQLDGVKPDIVLPDFYNYMELGERENDYPLQSNTIAPISYQQNVYRLGDLSKLKSASNGRVSSHPTFKKVEENAVRMRKQKDQTSYPLEAGRYKTLNRKQDEEAERFEDIFKSIEGFKVINLEIDALKMVDDTSKIARNNNWIKEKQKDIQLHEAFLIIQDMIRVDALSGRQ
jgi:carboxyl-terminal processing protease